MNYFKRIPNFSAKIILCILISFLFHQYNLYNIHIFFVSSNRTPFPIDIVYAWVDGHDPKWQQQFANDVKLYNISINKKQFDSRFEDYDELLYSLRSVDYYAPWVNKIYIITANQYPKWINLNHPKIKIVNQSELFPPNFPPPSYNAYAIEWPVYKIKNLSEHYIFFNDDFFIGKPLNYTFFFSPEGKPRVFCRKINWDKESRIIKKKIKRSNIEDFAGNQLSAIFVKSAKLFKKYTKKTPIGSFEHVQIPYTKSLVKSLFELFPSEINETLHFKFRNSKNIQIHILASFYGIMNNEIEPIEPNWTLNRFMLVNRKYDLREFNLSQVPSVFCLAVDNSKYKINAKEFMMNLYPKPSSFELIR